MAARLGAHGAAQAARSIAAALSLALATAGCSPRPSSTDAPIAATPATPADAPAPSGEPRTAQSIPVNVANFVRAESDLYFGRTVSAGGFGKFIHNRAMTPIDAQKVVRMNRDTLYSSGVFDLEASPINVSLPDPAGRFMSMQVISEDHFTTEVVYAPGRFGYTKDKVGTRYACIVIRTLANPNDAGDLKAAHRLQDAIEIEQARPGHFEVPAWDQPSQDKVRDALDALASLGGTTVRFGSKKEVDPVSHLIGTAMGWGGNPERAAMYVGVVPKANDGNTPHTITVKDVPVDGFWSISVYNARGYFEKNDLDAYSVNNLTARPNSDGSVTVQFGDCQKDTPNCLPITPGWNYTVRLYRPRKALINGQWTFPAARPVG